jgi:hypothetical protein
MAWDMTETADVVASDRVQGTAVFKIQGGQRLL